MLQGGALATMLDFSMAFVMLAYRPEEQSCATLTVSYLKAALTSTGTVIYRSKMHAGLKRNFQVMPGAEWLELLGKHIPDRYEHWVRYVGWYSNRARGERAKWIASDTDRGDRLYHPPNVRLWPLCKALHSGHYA